eukprot:XP_011671238.1 PREDICTED: piggyBac transposable element-derived protein 4-like [Strongylocentrotus purpuratus]
MTLNDVYLLIHFFLRDFVNNEDRDASEEEGYDPLFKIQPVIDRVCPTYQASFSPGRDLSMDESLVPFKGRVGFKQYLPLKPTKWGIKFWVITDSCTGFCLDWSVYTGKNEQQPRGGDGLTTCVVKNLSHAFNGSGRIVYTDSFCTSPDLYEYLHDQKLGACGTMRLNSKGLPPTMREASP